MYNQRQDQKQRKPSATLDYDETAKWEIKSVIAHRKTGMKQEVKIRWKHFEEPLYDTWELASDIRAQAPRILNDYFSGTEGEARITAVLGQKLASTLMYLCEWSCNDGRVHQSWEEANIVPMPLAMEWWMKP